MYKLFKYKILYKIENLKINWIRLPFFSYGRKERGPNNNIIIE